MKNNCVKYIFAATLLLPLFLFLSHVFAKDTPKVAYLTFDDGPTLNTPHIVEILERYDAAATFFVLEERIVMYPDFIKQIAHSKSRIGLHGVSHSEMIYATDTSPLEEMKKTDKALKNVIGNGSRLARVPFGSGYRLTKTQAELLRNEGYILWDWNVDPRDSVGKIVPEKIMENLKKDILRCKTAPVILLHDRKSTANLLPLILEYLTKEGYTMLPLSEKQTPVCQIDR